MAPSEKGAKIEEMTEIPQKSSVGRMRISCRTKMKPNVIKQEPGADLLRNMKIEPDVRVEYVEPSSDLEELLRIRRNRWDDPLAFKNIEPVIFCERNTWKDIAAFIKGADMRRRLEKVMRRKAKNIKLEKLAVVKTTNKGKGKGGAGYCPICRRQFKHVHTHLRRIHSTTRVIVYSLKPVSIRLTDCMRPNNKPTIASTPNKRLSAKRVFHSNAEKHPILCDEDTEDTVVDVVTVDDREAPAKNEPATSNASLTKLNPLLTKMLDDAPTNQWNLPCVKTAEMATSSRGPPKKRHRSSIESNSMPIVMDGCDAMEFPQKLFLCKPAEQPIVTETPTMSFQAPPKKGPRSRIDSNSMPILKNEIESPQKLLLCKPAEQLIVNATSTMSSQVPPKKRHRSTTGALNYDLHDGKREQNVPPITPVKTQRFSPRKLPRVKTEVFNEDMNDLTTAPKLPVAEGEKKVNLTKRTPMKTLCTNNNVFSDDLPCEDHSTPADLLKVPKVNTPEKTSIGGPGKRKSLRRASCGNAEKPVPFAQDPLLTKIDELSRRKYNSYFCTICPELPALQRSLAVNHQQEYHEELPFGRVFKIVPRLVPDPSRFCEVCGILFRVSTDHMEKYHSYAHKCLLCYELFYDESAGLLHATKFHPAVKSVIVKVPTKDVPVAVFKCENCTSEVRNGPFLTFYDHDCLKKTCTEESMPYSSYPLTAP